MIIGKGLIKRQRRGTLIEHPSEVPEEKVALSAELVDIEWVEIIEVPKTHEEGASISASLENIEWEEVV